MTTLTVYFASSSVSPSTSSSSTNTSSTTVIQTTRMAQNTTKPISIPSALAPNTESITATSPTSAPTIQRTSSKRNKTFFERFSETTPSSLAATPQSPTPQQQNPSGDTSADPPPRLRRRFTFRRSLRQSVRNKGGDIDDTLRSVIFRFCCFFLSFLS